LTDPYAGRALIIVNPASGRGNSDRTLRSLGAAFAARRASFDLLETAGAGDAERAARQGAQLGYRSVVAVGGDGTIAEAITGLAGSPVPLGIIPAGTANQLASNLGIPRDIERAVEVALHGTPMPMDIGQLGDGRYFALMAGAGWDAEVMRDATRELKNRYGFLAYLYAGLRTATQLPSVAFHITADGQEIEVRAASVMVANVGQLFHDLFPVGFWIGPGVSYRDGLLDVCIFAPQSVVDVATMLWKVAWQDFVGDQRMIYLQAREVVIESNPPIVTQADGDLVGTTPLRARAIPGGVRVLVPQ
jgi:YegS/Rv2252/BmrU family lipid kinase